MSDLPVDGEALTELADKAEGKDPMLTEDVAALFVAERERQIAVEGWTAEHDRNHGSDQLATAAGCYALPTFHRHRDSHGVPYAWPWAEEFWKPTPDDRQRELIKAGALLIAEIQRLSPHDVT